MTCDACGAQLKPGARFCGVCGSSIVNRPAETVVQPSAEPAPIRTGTLSRPAWLTTRVIAAAAALVVGIVVVTSIAVAMSGQVGGQSGGGAVDDGSGDATTDGDSGTTGSGTASGADTMLPPSQPEDPSAFRVSSWADGVWFVSPSGNLSCGISDDLWGCAIRERDWQFPSSSPEDFCYQSQISCGDGIAVRVGQNGNLPAPLQRGGAEFPDEAGLAVPFLQYGKSVSYGTVTCASTFENVVCADTSSGHGFVISRNENEIF